MLRHKSLTALLLAFVLVLAACGGGDADDTTTTVDPDSPLGTSTTVVEETTTTEAVDETTTTEAVEEFDVDAAIAEYAATIPEGWMAVSDITAFKDAVEASGALVIDVREPGEYAEGFILDGIAALEQRRKP